MALRAVDDAASVRLEPEPGCTAARAQWGMVRIVVRRADGALSLLPPGGARIELDADEVADLVGVGHAPHIDMTSLFGARTTDSTDGAGPG